MAHLIDSMAYVGQTPWHGLGRELDTGLPIDDWVVQAGMDWDDFMYRLKRLSNRPVKDSEARHYLLRVMADPEKASISKGAERNMARVQALYDGRRGWALTSPPRKAPPMGCSMR